MLDFQLDMETKKAKYAAALGVISGNLKIAVSHLSF